MGHFYWLFLHPKKNTQLFSVRLFCFINIWTKYTWHNQQWQLWIFLAQKALVLKWFYWSVVHLAEKGYPKCRTLDHYTHGNRNNWMFYYEYRHKQCFFYAFLLDFICLVDYWFWLQIYLLQSAYFICLIDYSFWFKIFCFKVRILYVWLTTHFDSKYFCFNVRIFYVWLTTFLNSKYICLFSFNIH